ncbi:hypothetical protein F383_04747 [Gossypium arboreum]|uniref:Uncharacterized protein n=1 Tax=Gossypium arboreum TaxID=29729 RepID=A0A0B0PQ50_GOSAR|nr:hypothetical protein F383_04747 [Gossypium arboreum]
MSRTCISYEMCQCNHVRDMTSTQICYSLCKTMSGTWHQHLTHI